MYTAIAIVLFVFCLLLFDSEKQSLVVKVLFSVFVCFFVFLEGCRWETGTDWFPYYNSFKTNSFSNMYEIGYNFLSLSIRSVTDDYTVFLMIIAIIWYYALSNFIMRYSLDPLLSLCIAYCIFLPYLGMNRQFLAMAIILLSIYFIVKRMFLPFIGFVILAMCFHRTAFFFLPAYYLYNIELEKKWIIILVTVSTVIGVVGILNILPLNAIAPFLDDQSAYRLSHYSQTESSVSILNGLLFRSFIIVLCFFVRVPKFHKKNYTFFFNMYLVSVLLYVLFQSSALRILSTRGGLYYSISMVVLATYVVRFISCNKFIVMACYLLFFVLYLYTMNKGIDIYITFLGKDIFRPYKGIFLPDGFEGMF